jgi:hypothetical protein
MHSISSIYAYYKAPGQRHWASWFGVVGLVGISYGEKEYRTMFMPMKAGKVCSSCTCRVLRGFEMRCTSLSCRFCLKGKPLVFTCYVWKKGDVHPLIMFEKAVCLTSGHAPWSCLKKRYVLSPVTTKSLVDLYLQAVAVHVLDRKEKP